MIKIKIKDEEKKLWAPYCWYLIHVVAYTFCHHIEPKYRIFFQKLGEVLPCPKCKDHFQEYIKKNPIHKDTNLINWSIDYHNDVNRLSNKPILKKKEIHNLFYVEDPDKCIEDCQCNDNNDSEKFNSADNEDCNSEDDRDFIPINHQYIKRLIEILYVYHKDEGTLPIFFDFLYNLRKVFPCLKCREDLRKKRNRNLKSYIRICNGNFCTKSKNKLLKYQKYKINPI